MMRLVVMLGLVTLVGCSGPAFRGTLNEGGPPLGGTGTPVPSQGQPVVSDLSPASVVAGGGTFTITVTGQNFASGDTVELDNDSFPLSCTFVSSTQMTAQVPSQFITEPTSHAVIVQTPAHYSITFGATLTITAAPQPGTAGFTLSTQNIQANDMVWDQSTQQIYLSVAGTDPAHPNSIAALDPVTGQIDATVSAGTGADRLAVSSDGSSLYAGIDKNSVVQRFLLPSLASDITIPLGTDSSSQPYYAIDVEADPAGPNTIAVSRATSPTAAGNIAIYDGTVPRTALASSPSFAEPFGSLVWNATGSNIYGAFNSNLYDSSLFTFTVNSNGIQLSGNDELNQPGQAFSLGILHYSALTGYLYNDAGAQIDPSNDSVINGLPTAAVQGTSAYVTPRLTLDDGLGMAWVLVQQDLIQNQPYVIEAFDLRTNVLLGSISIPNVVGTPVKLIRWGSNGLAFLTNGAKGPEQGDGVYIISGAFVTTPSMQLRKGH